MVAFCRIVISHLGGNPIRCLKRSLIDSSLIDPYSLLVPRLAHKSPTLLSALHRSQLSFVCGDYVRTVGSHEFVWLGICSICVSQKNQKGMKMVKSIFRSSDANRTVKSERYADGLLPCGLGELVAVIQGSKWMPFYCNYCRCILLAHLLARPSSQRGLLLRAKEKERRSSIVYRSQERENYKLIYERERRKTPCRLPKLEPKAEYQCRALLLSMGAGNDSTSPDGPSLG